MRIVKIAGMLLLLSVSVVAQHFPKMDTRNYITDTTVFVPHKPWRAVAEIVGLNIGVWGFNRFITKGDFAYINFKTIKNNFKTGPLWDVDKFSTNLVAHPYHGSLYYNAARSNGMNLWQSVPYTLGGSLMWEFIMENEPPSINDMIATTFGGIELGEITYRLSDLFIDNRSFGSERVGREILVGVISPIRALNRIVTGEAWKRTPYKGRVFESVPINFIVNVGPRFLAEQEETRDGSVSMHVAVRLDYGDPYDDEFYSPYEWFQLRAGFDFFNSQSLISQVNAIGALWGKAVWKKDTRNLAVGIFQHFAYYDSQLKNENDEKVSPYRIAEAASVGGGLIYNKKPSAGEKVDIYAELYANGVALGASLTDYFFLDERDYNLGSGYSVKGYTGITYNKKWSFTMNLENYHIFTWKGYDPDIDWSSVGDPNYFNSQGDKGNSRLTVFGAQLVYYSGKRWNVNLANRYFARRTYYKYHEDVSRATYDIALTFGVKI